MVPVAPKIATFCIFFEVNEVITGLLVSKVFSAMQALCN